MTGKNWPERKFLILVVVVFGTSLGAGLLFSLERTRPVSHFSLSDGSVLSQVGVQGTDSLSFEPAKGVAGRKVLVRESASLDFDLVSWEKTAEKTILRLTEALEKNEPLLIYDFLGSDFQGMFTREDFVRSLLPSSKISQAEIIDGPRISGAWSEFIVELVLEDGSSRQHLVVFHLEDGIWRLFGTEEAN